MRPRDAHRLPISCILLFGIEALLLTAVSGPQGCVSATSRGDDPDGQGPPATSAPAAHGIEVDLERLEIRFPCRFVNPTQLLEVFACHQRGPTHETLVAFDAPGPAIYAGLLRLGCRSASYWNGTSPRDFEKNQGDRLLVLVRWKLHGVEHEQPAEGMLLEGETGFPMPVRGFSFGARGAFRVDVPAERAPGEETEDAQGTGADGEAKNESDADAAEARLERTSGVPIAVEISLGASVRQSVPHSLLSHPTSSARMNP
ncbi:MAG TPA: YdjY domain-containing protein, partial [Planctomycetota bacterium]|nr:YdjY domain-containing protein [Planctomycetota bacterium]